MKALVNGLSIFIRADGAVLILLGIFFWTGNADALIPVHMLLGICLVLALLTLAIIAATQRVSMGLVALACVWSLVTPALGVTQTRILPFNGHWIVQVAHLLVGLTAIALSQFLATATLRRMSGAPTQTVSAR
jgi:hypothetical protein